jgi:hypothetical protein
MIKAYGLPHLFAYLALLLLFDCAAAQQANSSKLYPISENGKVGFIDERGSIIIKPQFDAVAEFSEGLAEAQSKDQWGFIDATGSWVVEPRFAETKPFSEGLAAVKINGKWGFIDKVGNMVVEPQHSWVDGFSEGLAAADFILGDDDDGYTVKHGYIDTTGRIVIEPKFDFAHKFIDGLAIVDTDTGQGFIDKRGEFVIKPQLLTVSNFSEGLAKVSVGLGKTLEDMNFKEGFIDKTGRWVVKPQFGLAEDFSEGMAIIKNKIDEEYLYGYVDKTGRIIVKPQFKGSLSFHEGLAAVKIDDREGYIDKTGRIVIKPRFEDASSFSEGLARVKVRDKASYIDKTGKMVIPPQFDSAEDFVNGLAKVRKGRVVGYINKSGEYVWSTSRWDAERAADVKIAQPVKPVRQPFYFPPNALDDDGYSDEWYSKHLAAMGEPSLWLASKDTKVRVYRFTWLRSFHHPVAVRLNIAKDGTAILSAKVTTGMGGYEPGELRTDKNIKLTKAQVDQFLELIEKAKFWQPPVKEKPAPKINEDGTVTEEVGLDGAQWIIEGVENGKYQLKDVWSPKEGAHREAALLLIKFAELQIKEIY